VFVKHFEFALDERHPEVRRRLETRLLVCQTNGAVYGVTYKWRPDNSDADLLSTNLTEAIAVNTAAGVRTQTWYYPSRQDCRTCHSSNAGGVLGLKTRQMNRSLVYPNGVVDNQLRTWNHAGLFETALDDSEIPSYAGLAPASDGSRSLEERARSYLDANCAYCHRPGGTVAYFDARFDTPLEKQGLVNGLVLIDEGLDKARVIAPNDPWRSVALLRISTLEGLRMPPLAHETLDAHGVDLLKAWITSLPGPKVLAPPVFSSRGATEKAPFELTLAHPDPQAAIHYTLDGTAPATDDPVYRGPIKISESTTVRARAFRAGYAKSITVQETFVFPTLSTKP
jgi:mono/diheme cytochrome c family protein